MTVKGPKGTLTKNFRDDITITIADKTITFAINRNDKFSKSLWGTYASHIKNMITGVQTPYRKEIDSRRSRFQIRSERHRPSFGARFFSSSYC